MVMKKMKIVMVVLAILALVSVVSAALPGMVTATVNHPGASWYWTVDVASPGITPELPAANGYQGWCTDTNNYLTSGSTHTFEALSSLVSVPAYVPTEDWKAVNYILNVPPSNDDWKIKQAAMWHYDGMSAVPYPEHDVVKNYDHAVYDSYITEIDANKDAFDPKCEQKYAIILYKRGVQAVIVEGTTEDCQNTPEFPTLALPVAMLIGFVGMIQIIRSRKE